MPAPFWKQTLKTIDEVKKELRITATVKKTQITSEEEAKRHSFQVYPQCA
jgi:hypothetical protein